MCLSNPQEYSDFIVSTPMSFTRTSFNKFTLGLFRIGFCFGTSMAGFLCETSVFDLIEALFCLHVLNRDVTTR